VKGFAPRGFEFSQYKQKETEWWTAAAVEVEVAMVR